MALKIISPRRQLVSERNNQSRDRRTSHLRKFRKTCLSVGGLRPRLHATYSCLFMSSWSRQINANSQSGSLLTTFPGGNEISASDWPTIQNYSKLLKTIENYCLTTYNGLKCVSAAMSSPIQSCRCCACIAACLKNDLRYLNVFVNEYSVTRK